MGSEVVWFELTVGNLQLSWPSARLYSWRFSARMAFHPDEFFRLAVGVDDAVRGASSRLPRIMPSETPIHQG